MTSNFLLVTTVKNEGPNILEWVAYHRTIGFDRIHVYQNDSDDETQKTLRTLDKIGAIKYFRNECPKQQWQNKAYRRTSFHEDYAATKWCMALDGDEFLNIKIGNGQLSELVSALGHADEIRLNWRNFGCGGNIDLSPDLITERFMLGDPSTSIQHNRMGFKTLFKAQCFKRPGIHSPKVPQKEELLRVNGSGVNCTYLAMTSWRSVDPMSRSIAQINHYPIRDVASFVLKTRRGSASHTNRKVEQAYWDKFNHNVEQDITIQRHLPAIQKEMDRLNSLSKGRLFMLRARSLELWQEKLNQILTTEDGKALKQSLLQTVNPANAGRPAAEQPA